MMVSGNWAASRSLLNTIYPALSWFKDHFIKCNERAALVKTWLPAQYDGPKSWLDQLVYDRALLLVRISNILTHPSLMGVDL